MPDFNDVVDAVDNHFKAFQGRKGRSCMARGIYYNDPELAEGPFFKSAGCVLICGRIMAVLFEVATAAGARSSVCQLDHRFPFFALEIYCFVQVYYR